MWEGLANAIGIKAAVIAAAFGGGVVRIAVFGAGGTSPGAIVFSVICGAITAVFVGPIVPAYLGWQDNSRSTLAFTFFVGVFFMEILKQIAGRIAQWQPSSKGPKDA